jgi:peptide/nickel transport system permease protein
MGFAVLGFAVPVFVAGYILIYFFAINARLAAGAGLPPIGQGLWPFAESLILPSIALGTTYMALIARITRASMLEVLAQDYIRTAEAKGLATRPRAAAARAQERAVPIVTVIGIGIALLISRRGHHRDGVQHPGPRAADRRRRPEARLSDHPGR